MRIIAKSKKLLALCLVVVMAMGVSMTSLAAETSIPVKVYKTTTQNAPDSIQFKPSKAGRFYLRIPNYTYGTYNIGYRTSKGGNGNFALNVTANQRVYLDLQEDVTYYFRFSSYTITQTYIPLDALYEFIS
jgi:hypothetical protein